MDQDDEIEKAPNSDWSPIFNPDDFNKKKDQLKKELYALDKEAILTYAKEVTLIRSRLTTKSQKVEDDEKEPDDLNREKTTDKVSMTKRIDTGSKDRS